MGGTFRGLIGNFRITIPECGCKRQFQLRFHAGTHPQTTCKPDLFLEKIFKCLAGIEWPRRSFRGSRRMGRGRRWRRILLDGGTKFIEGAIVSLVFSGNSFRHGLHALETRGGIEIGALFARVQFKRAFRALPFRVKARLQHRATIGAARARDGADHSRRARPNLILSRVAFRRPPLFFLGLVGTHVALLLVLPLQRNLQGDV
jgi:hypothetical protein